MAVNFMYGNNSAVFEKAELRLMRRFHSNRKVKNLLSLLLEELSSGRLHRTLSCLQELYNELDFESFAEFVNIINEAFAGRGVEFGIAMMPGASAHVSINCLSINLVPKKRVLLLPLINSGSVQLCQASQAFLGTNFWMETIRNEDPDLAFKQMVGFIAVDPQICPPPMTSACLQQSYY